MPPNSAAAHDESERPPSRGRTVVGNALLLVVGQPVTWSLTLLFLLIVPRAVGPAAWGEITLATAIGAAAAIAIDLGLNNLLLKEVGRDRQGAADRVAAALAFRAILGLGAFLVVLAVTEAAHFSRQLQVVVVVVTLSALTTSAVGPAVSALQGLERMIFSTVGAFVTSALAMLSATIAVAVFSAGVVGVAFAGLGAAIAGAALQLYFLQRLMPVRPRFAPSMIAGLAMRGLPFYTYMLTFTVYAWADAILLAAFAPTTVVGWYGASTRLLAATGFIPMAVTIAVFPALALAQVQDRQAMASLAQKALLFVSSLGVPFSAGLALVAPGIMRTVYGTSFEPAEPVLVVLSLTLVPVFIATVASSVVFASDRQVRWTVVMAVCCAANIALNAVAIPYFQAVYKNGAVGAAAALLLTDTMVGAGALVLLPRDVLLGVARQSRQIGMSVLATAGMVAVVWPVRSQFVLLPILVGLATYAALALAFSVYDRGELRLIGELTIEAAGRFWRLATGSRRRPESAALPPVLR